MLIKFRVFSVSGIIVMTAIMLTGGIAGISNNLVYGLVTGKNIGSTANENVLTPGVTSEVKPEIEQENECYDETDCDNKTGTESKIEVIGPEGPPGPQGPKGDKGEQGIPGIQGEQCPEFYQLGNVWVTEANEANCSVNGLILIEYPFGTNLVGAIVTDNAICDLN